MKVAVFIQARMGSTRLPGKVLLKLGTKEVLGQVIHRAQESEVGEVFVLTTLNKQDIPIVRFCSEKNVRVFCGSENDVLDRFWQAAKLLDVDHIVRVTADCPLIDPEIIANIVREHYNCGADYTSNTLVETFPDGLDVEVFKKTSLEQAWREAKLGSEREHVTPYIKKNPRIFILKSITNSIDLSNMRWTIDQEEDYHFLQRIFSELSETNKMRMNDVLDLLERKPSIKSINEKIMRNEGYFKSLREDELRG